MKKVLKWTLIIFIAIICTIIYARFIGTMGLVTKEYTITSKEIPNNFSGLKIVHFSDLHYNRAITINKVKSIVEEINYINPDIVVFTGDLIDQDAIITSKEFEELTKIFTKIKAKYGKYAILGNHDYINQKDNIIKLYYDSNFKYLDNNYDIIYNKNREKIFIGGINTTTYNQKDINKTMEYFNNNSDIEYKIMLTHEPDITDEILKNYHVNLILAGHSHGGQIRMPLIGPIYTPPYSKKYYNEYYQIKDTELYISSGVGVSTINYRLFNHPSINFYRINNKK